jgi:NAD(P)H-dependent FMN reductase
MDQSITIAVIEGTLREKRESIKAARFVAEIGGQFEGVDIIFVDPADFIFPNDGNSTEGKDPRYTEIVTKADGFFIVTPEYNHSYPGALKRMLDSEYKAYHRKAVAVAGVSNGDWGGTRAVEGLLPALRSLGLLPVRLTAYFPRVQDIFDENGHIRPEQADKYTKAIKGEFAELIWTARALKWGRDNS